MLHAAVWDITSRPPDSEKTGRTYSLPDGVKPGSVDVITVIYVLSALHPVEWEQAIHNLYTVRIDFTPFLLAWAHNSIRRSNREAHFSFATTPATISPSCELRRTVYWIRICRGCISEETAQEYIFSRRPRWRV